MNWVNRAPGVRARSFGDMGTCYGGAMAVTVEDLDRRATVLERTQNETVETLRWAAATLGQMKAVQDEHTQRLGRMQAVQDEHTQRLNDHTQRLERIETTLGDHSRRLDRLEAKVDAIPRAVAVQIEATERRLLAAIAAR
jgi:hypothetical protein